MRKAGLTVLSAMLCLAVPVTAGASGDRGALAVRKEKSPPAPKSPSKVPSGRPVKPAKPELQQLRDLIQEQQGELAAQRKALQEQQREIDELKSRSTGQTTSVANPQPGAAPSVPAAPSAIAAAALPTPAAASEKASSATSVLRTTESSSANHAITASVKAPQQANEPKLGPLSTDKIQIGVTFFGDYGFYNETGFGPQFITQINQPGPGNDHFNSFDVTRTYLNFFYTPNDAVTLRVTPNIFRQVDGSSGAIGNGKGAQIGGSTNGNLSFRIKYAYVEFNKLFAHSAAFGKTKITIGSETQPLTDWEEGLSGYRYAYLTPWNYLSLSSTFVGAKIHGPIEFNGKEYLDYDIGVFDTASFHAIEQNDKKDAMARLTFYPEGTTSDRTGFGVTFFENYGYNTQTPDTRSIPLNRIAVIPFFQTHSKSAQIAFEYDLGRNAFGSGNLFSGAAPVAGGPFFMGGAATDLGTVAASVLAGDRTRQQGYDVFGHVKLGNSQFALFGMFQYFQPNTHFDPSLLGLRNDPIDFEHTVGGVSYHYNTHLDLAIEDSNFHWIHPQGTFGTKDTNGIFLNFQFNY